MPRIFLHAPLPAHHNALSELLGLWAEMEQVENVEDADVILWQGEAPARGAPSPSPPPSGGRPTLYLHTAPPSSSTLGADDLVCPVRWATLAQRLCALMETPSLRSFRVGPFVCAPRERVLKDANGQEQARLTEKEVGLLLYLHRQKGKTVNRARLLDGVWGYAEGLETHTLETHIYRLRQKIERDPEKPAHLLTCDGGYALVPPRGTQDETHTT